MDDFRFIQNEIAVVRPVKHVGRVVEIVTPTVSVSGIIDVARIGDHVELCKSSGESLRGEIIALCDNKAKVLPQASCDGLALGERVIHLGSPDIAPDHRWLGRVINAFGEPIDGRPIMRGLTSRPVLSPPPPSAYRRSFGSRLPTGYAAFDTMLPLVKGQRIGLFSGSGVGKSTLLGGLARHVEADVTVIALIGERGREVSEFIANGLPKEAMQRCVVVVATSDEAPQVRRRAAWTAMTVAEYFRDEGKSVLLLADSITRFAEAHRDVALAAGEASVLEGFPASTAQMIMSLCERAGPGWKETGDVTAIFSVLVPGDDMDGAIADIMRGVMDGHVVLARSIAERGRFPAVDVLRSVSRSLPIAATERENALITKARKLLGAYDQSEMMIQSGLYKSGNDSFLDRAIALWPALDSFLGESSENIASSFQKLETALNAHQPR